MSKLLIGKLKLKIEDFACFIVDHLGTIVILLLLFNSFCILSIDKHYTEFLYFKDSKFVGIAKYSEIKKHSDCLYVIDECFVCSDNSIYKIK